MGIAWHLVLSDPDKDPGPLLADSNSRSGPNPAECGPVVNDPTVLKKAKK